jgi:hypothetical protein
LRAPIALVLRHQPELTVISCTCIVLEEVADKELQQAENFMKYLSMFFEICGASLQRSRTGKSAPIDSVEC